MICHIHKTIERTIPALVFALLLMGCGDIIVNLTDPGRQDDAGGGTNLPDGSVADGGTIDPVGGGSTGGGSGGGTGADDAAGPGDDAAPDDDAGTGGDDATPDDGGGSADDDTVGDDTGLDGGDTDVDLPALTSAAVIHRGAGGFLVDPTVNLPAEATFNVSSGGIKTAVQRAQISKDGSRVWFATQDNNGFVTPQLFCINPDGTGLQEFAYPSDLTRLPAEMAVSADGETCAMILSACGTGGCSGFAFTTSVILVAHRSTGQVTTVFDARTLESGENDYLNLQIADDGSFVTYLGWDSRIIYSTSTSGGLPVPFIHPSSFTRTGATVDGPVKFRTNGDASAVIAVVSFDAGSGSYPRDAFLYRQGEVTAVTNTGDAYSSNNILFTDMGVTDDARFVAYVRQFSGNYVVYVLDRQTNETRTITTVPSPASAHQLLLDPDGTVLFTGYGMPLEKSNVDELPGLGTLDGASALEVNDAWLHSAVQYSSMSRAGGAFVGLWDSGAFGDTHRLVIWYPGLPSYRRGPQITDLSYTLDAANQTLTVRAAASGTVSKVTLFAFKDNFQSYYVLAEADDPFFTERFGQDLTRADEGTFFEHTATLGDLTMDSSYRVRVGVSDESSKTFSYVDFRPVPNPSETEDLNADGAPG